MAKVQWDGGAEYTMVLEGHSDAPPAAVYDELADLSTHLTWGGTKQYPGFRLLSLDASGPAKVGTRFASVGSIPMTRVRWENDNEVTQARPGEVLELRTHAVARWRSGRRTDARYEHRYDIESDGAGSHVTYRLRQTAIADPPLRMRMPLGATLANRVMIPRFCRRGFRAMLRLAAERDAARAVDPTPALRPNLLP